MSMFVVGYVKDAIFILFYNPVIIAVIGPALLSPVTKHYGQIKDIYYVVGI
jgi:hypothetical protein